LSVFERTQLTYLPANRGFFPKRGIARGSERDYFDPAQMQQALINLLKNAAESGGPSEEIAIAAANRAPGSCRSSTGAKGWTQRR